MKIKFQKIGNTNRQGKKFSTKQCFHFFEILFSINKLIIYKLLVSFGKNMSCYQIIINYDESKRTDKSYNSDD
jgi:hypothetical protein